jgi:Fur family transcriptional regulator, ferric uptake regulator
MQKNESGLKVQLSEKGIRLTRQRRLLLDLIEEASDHLHASDLVKFALERGEKIDRATVYRTLGLLKDQGLIEELDLLHLDGPEHHYEAITRKSHIHIGCTKCGKIMEFETDLVANIEDEISCETGFLIRSTRVEVSALCPDCQGKEREKA